MMTSKISVTILTKNSQRYLPEVLQALEAFDEVLVCDTGSNDKTLEIAQQFSNVTLQSRPFVGFGPTHNIASGLARNDWILSIDSDEVAGQEMINSITQETLDVESVYTFTRDNYYKGKWIRWCGWYPDRQTRLYNRKHTRFTDAQVHEGVITEGMKIIDLQSSMKHYSYSTVSDFLDKMQSYSTLFAKQNRGKKKSSMCKAVLHGIFSFFKSYILKKGFMGGSEGFEISIYNANTAFYKYLKLAEANRQLPTEECGDDLKG